MRILHTFHKISQGVSYSPENDVHMYGTLNLHILLWYGYLIKKSSITRNTLRAQTSTGLRLRDVKQTSQVWNNLANCLVSCPTYPENFKNIHSSCIILITNSDPQIKNKSCIQGAECTLPKMFQIVSRMIIGVSWKFHKNHSSISHYDDVIMARWRLKSPAPRLFTEPFIQTQTKEKIKAPRHWPLCGEFTGDRWIPRTNGQ